MKKLILIFFTTLILTSCHKYGEITVEFNVCNKTQGELAVEFSSWGDYSVIHGTFLESPHKFHPTETVGANREVSISISVVDDDYEGLPPQITPAWNYIVSIECMRVKVPESYFKDPANWKISRRAYPFVGDRIIVELVLTPEILTELNKENPYL